MPKNKRILVLGARGMLGSALVLHLHKLGYDTLALNRSQFDACRDSVTKLELNGLSLVINAIGLINRRLSDKNAVADFCLVNSVFPRVLADHCAVQKVSMIHITTDCVFTGSNGPYNENDTHDADDFIWSIQIIGGKPKLPSITYLHHWPGTDKPLFFAIMVFVPERPGLWI